MNRVVQDDAVPLLAGLPEEHKLLPGQPLFRILVLTERASQAGVDGSNKVACICQERMP